MTNVDLTDNSKLKRSELIFLIISAVLTITLVSTCSPLYPYNPWDDANCFFTLGRGIKHGLIPYRDLYEQKGPLLYFIYAAAAFISEKSFIGAWIFECLAASVFAIFSWKTVKLFTEPSGYSITVMPLFLGITYTVYMFNFGGNAEELCFPLITYALYIALRSIVVNNSLPSNTEALLCGVITAALFWIKYTFLGFMIGFVIVIVFIAIKNKDFKRLWSLIWRFLAGFALLSVPILIYFLANNALSSLWEAYFYNNIFLYQSNESLSGIAKIPVIKNLVISSFATVGTAIKYPSFGILLLLSFVSVFFVDKKYRKKTALVFFITFFTSIILVFTKASYIYYYGYLLSYCLGMGLILPVKLLGKLSKLFKDNARFMKILLSGLFIIFYGVSVLLCKNMYLFLQPKQAVTQYRIADIIKETPGAKVLTYDVMDAGFYTTAEILPSNRFYCFLNIESNYPAILEEQNRLISEGYFDYIVTTSFCECNWEHYELAAEESGIYVDHSGEKCLDCYRLYKRI